MRFYVVSDKNDTYMGMRLAGMEGFLSENPQAVSYTHLDVSKRQLYTRTITSGRSGEFPK